MYFFRFFLLLLTIVFTLPQYAFAYELNLNHLINDNERICVNYLADDGCNTCTLDLRVSSNGLELDYACTELACWNTDIDEKNQCNKYLPIDAFYIPPVKGEIIKNCSKILLKDRACELNFNQNKGTHWICKNHKEPITTQFKEPLCIENLEGQIVNGSEIARIKVAKQKQIDVKRVEKMDALPLCVQYEDACYRYTPKIFPSQTNQNLSHKSLRGPKFSQDEMRNCQRNKKNNNRKCVHEIIYGDLPPINFDNQTHWLERNKGIKLEDNCVRYENECFAYYIGLSGYNKDELTWTWYPKQKRCPMDIYKNGGNHSPMSCTSFYDKD